MGNREQQLHSFLDFVEANKGRLLIAGDLFEFWQMNLSKVIVAWRSLLDRLDRMQTEYLVGNHDTDLAYFIDSRLLSHPFFARMERWTEKRIGGKWFKFMHGHEVDPYCADDSPGWGRITATISGLLEDRNGSPIKPDGNCVEDRFIGKLEAVVSVWDWLVGGVGNRSQAMLQEFRKHRDEAACDVIVAGHTHEAGRIGEWYFNCGTWSRDTNSFVCINDNGTAGLFDWIDGKSVPNPTVLPIVL